MSCAFTSLIARAKGAEPAVVQLRLSQNDKTGVSLNTPIVGTCRPTPACRRYCYGLGGPISMSSSLRVQNANLAALDGATSDADVERLADLLAAQCDLAHTDFLRVNGVGDLTPSSVRVLASLARRHPTLTLWVATRKPELAMLLPDVPNVQIMLSLDGTSSTRAWVESRWLVERRPRGAFLAYVRASADDAAPADVAIVFEQHRSGNRAAWPPDARACGATVRDGVEHEGACAACRRCFNPDVRQGGDPCAL